MTPTECSTKPSLRDDSEKEKAIHEALGSKRICLKKQQDASRKVRL